MADHKAADEVAADARQRAWRTFWQGVATDALIAVVLVAQSLLADIQWTRAYWVALAALLAKTVMQAAVSSLARKLVPPAPL